MESGSEVGTYIAYAFVVLFLLLVAVAAARSYGMILSLVVMAFLPDRQPSTKVGDTESSPDSDNKPHA